MLKKAIDLENLLLLSEGGVPGGGVLPHVGYGIGIYKLHKFLKDRYKRKLADELNRSIFRESDSLRKLLK